jgi:hypothetical protein
MARKNAKERPQDENALRATGGTPCGTRRIQELSIAQSALPTPQLSPFSTGHDSRQEREARVATTPPSKHRRVSSTDASL